MVVDVDELEKGRLFLWEGHGVYSSFPNVRVFWCFVVSLMLIGALKAKTSPALLVEGKVETLVRERDWSGAVAYLEKEAARVPANWRLQYLLGVLYLQTDQQDTALKVFGRLREAEGEISDLPPTGLPIEKLQRKLIWGEEMN